MQSRKKRALAPRVTDHRAPSERPGIGGDAIHPHRPKRSTTNIGSLAADGVVGGWRDADIRMLVQAIAGRLAYKGGTPPADFVLGARRHGRAEDARCFVAIVAEISAEDIVR